jgi:dTDP-D-glucose 4,6-dehydratase
MIIKRNYSPISCVETLSYSVNISSKVSAVNAPKHLFINAEITDLESVGEVKTDKNRYGVQ